MKNMEHLRNATVSSELLEQLFRDQCRFVEGVVEKTVLKYLEIKNEASRLQRVDKPNLEIALLKKALTEIKDLEP